MLDVFLALLRSMLSEFRSHSWLVLENLALRLQLAVLHRQARKPKLHPADRLLWVGLRRFWPHWQYTLPLFQPQTSSAWHLRGFRLFWRSKSRCRSGRPSSVWQKTRSNRIISRPLSAMRIGSHSIRGAEFGIAGLAMEHGELMTEGFKVSLNCPAAIAILALAGKTSRQGLHVAAVARSFWPRWSSSNRRGWRTK